MSVVASILTGEVMAGETPTPTPASRIAAAAVRRPDKHHFETFYEMLAWKALSAHRVLGLPQRCGGAFKPNVL